MKHKIRYSIASQMKEYDTIKENWIPFIMFMQRPNYRSKVVNTDNYGFRFNNTNKSMKSIFDYGYPKKIIIGNSMVFGVGATSDNFTLPSLLSQKNNEEYINFGGRAFSGFQEIILFTQFINKLKYLDELIIISGINDLFLMKQSNNFNYFENLIYNNTNFVNKMNKKNKNSIFDFVNLFFKKENTILLPSSKRDKKEISITNIERNISFWSFIKKAFKIKVRFYLQPCATWCKTKLSLEEQKIFDELDNHHQNNKIQKLFTREEHKDISALYAKNCNENDIEYLDLNNELVKFDNNKNWLFVDRVHLTDLGYKKLTQIISK